MSVIIYHNPRCSKSRQTLKIIEEKGIIPEVRKYLEQPPKEAELQELSKQLGVPYSKMVRTKEEEFTDFVSDPKDDKQCLQAMLKFPKVIERPIVISKGKAVFGRPPENVLEIL